MPKRLTSHRVKPWMLRDRITIVVVGCGGTGSALISGLPYLHHALLAVGHPAGIRVCAIDGDRISETNCVRQPFTANEIGLYKTQVLINRLNVFWHSTGVPFRRMCGVGGTFPTATFSSAVSIRVLPAQSWLALCD